MAASKYQNTQYSAEDFVESAGAILFRKSTKQICLLHHKSQDKWLLPKGRRNIGESRADAALREVQEESGFHCYLFPVTMRSRCTPSSGSEEEKIAEVKGKNIGFIHDKPRLYKSIYEPFMVTHRVLPNGAGIKLIFWYIAAVIDGVEAQEEDQFSAKFFDFEEALDTLTYASDREIVAKAIEIFDQTLQDQEQSPDIAERAAENLNRARDSLKKQ